MMKGGMYLCDAVGELRLVHAQALGLMERHQRLLQEGLDTPHQLISTSQPPFLCRPKSIAHASLP